MLVSPSEAHELHSRLEAAHPKDPLAPPRAAEVSRPRRGPEAVPGELAPAPAGAVPGRLTRCRGAGRRSKAGRRRSTQRRRGRPRGMPRGRRRGGPRGRLRDGPRRRAERGAPRQEAERARKGYAPCRGAGAAHAPRSAAHGRDGQVQVPAQAEPAGAEAWPRASSLREGLRTSARRSAPDWQRRHKQNETRCSTRRRSWSGARLSPING